MSISEQRIREFAYQIWESEGKPHGHTERHWEMASKLAQVHAASANQVGEEVLQQNVQQAGSTEPAPSVEPIQPISPTEPAQPVPPSDPIQPTDPVQPAQPVQPGAPVARTQQVAQKSAQSKRLRAQPLPTDISANAPNTTAVKKPARIRQSKSQVNEFS